MRRFFEPAAAPSWLKPVLASIRSGLSDIFDAPIRPAQYATADLPTAADHTGGLVYDTTTDAPKFSDGSAWQRVMIHNGGAALTRVDDTNVTLTLGGTPATALLQAASITVGWSGQLGLARGGTGASTAAGARTALELGTIATQAASEVAITGGSISGLTTLLGPTGNIGTNVPGIAFDGITDAGLVGQADNVGIIESGVLRILLSGSTEKAARVPADHKLGWSSANDNLSSADTYLERSGAGVVRTGGDFDVVGVYKVDGTQVVGAQGAAVADATDAASAITQLNALLARCRAHGLIAS